MKTDSYRCAADIGHRGTNDNNGSRSDDRKQDAVVWKLPAINDQLMFFILTASSQLRDICWIEVRVDLQRSPRLMQRKLRHLLKAVATLKQTTDGFMPQIRDVQKLASPREA